MRIASLLPLSCALALLPGAGCSSQQREGLPIGLILPRTGPLADSGGHAESAVLLAAERINLAGGVAGKPITLVVKDTRSDAKTGVEAAQKLLADYEVVGIIGPEEEDVALEVVEKAKESKLVQISGGISSPRFTTVDDGGFFFRTCPSTQVTADALVTRMYEDGNRTATFLFVSTEFGTAFVSSAVMGWRGLGGKLLSPGSLSAPVTVQQGQKDYRELLNSVLPFKPQALLIVADPLTGAKLVSDWKLLGGSARIYLAPTLMTDVFVQGVPPGALEGAVGVSALSGDSEDAFAESYTATAGSHPAQAAFFYYDAMALMALAIERAAKVAGKNPGGDQIKAALLEVASPPGAKVRWDELGSALDKVRAGEDIDYDGASGNIDFDANGDVTLEKVGFWTVSASSIVR